MTNLSTERGVFVLFCSVVLGIVLGLFYCIISALRMSSTSKFFLFFWDFICCPVSAVIAYLFFVAALSGEIRIFAVLGIGVGFASFYYYIGRNFRKVLVKVILFFKKIADTVLKPVKHLSEIITNSEIGEKIFKKLLKKVKSLLYNKKTKLICGGGTENGSERKSIEKDENCF